MMKNLIVLLAVTMVSTYTVADQTWDGGGADDRWLTAENWDADTLPDAGERVLLEEAGGTILIEEGDYVNPRKIIGPTYNTPVTTTMTFTGGEMQNTSYWNVATVSMGTGIINITGPTSYIYTRDLVLGDNGGIGILNMTAGKLEIYGDNNTTGSNTGFFVPFQDSEASESYVNLDGGVITTGYLMMYAGGVIDIGGNGRLEIAGDQRTQIQTWIDAEMITAEDDTLDPTVIYDGTDTVLISPNNNEYLFNAWGPSPGIGTLIPEPYVTLTWEPGATADKHDVYFGTDPCSLALVADDIETTSYELGEVDFAATYYWRVDEIDLDTPETYTGDVWSFSTRGSLPVEEFETYVGDPNLELVWAEGAGVDVSLTGSPAQGGQAMQVAYNNSVAPFYSETTATGLREDFNSYSVVQMQVWYYGATANSGEKMYVEMSDGTNTALVQNDAIVTQDPSWNIWRIALSDFTDANPTLDMTSIDTMTIGIGDKNSPQASGSGTIYVDNLRLRLAQCLTPPTYDLNDDCAVDLSDFALLASEWMANGIWP